MSSTVFAIIKGIGLALLAVIGLCFMLIFCGALATEWAGDMKRKYLHNSSIK